MMQKDFPRIMREKDYEAIKEYTERMELVSKT